ncbi:BspA family leucine-rich repeat surface protein [Enterococcus mundtii]|uniref:BspA family leucine-rich repeat surface protein n=1 Tax=Enterococcus mundtii TaxID=53346 RepID=A0A848MUD7_ENTMU|nr:BspA family leucine-rich repeat surface protein [Enterococcus mundtii]NMP59537.1 BspA family leucine-rich repeat surface protein [Enterococcus mundtii]
MKATKAVHLFSAILLGAPFLGTPSALAQELTAAETQINVQAIQQFSKEKDRVLDQVTQVDSSEKEANFLQENQITIPGGVVSQTTPEDVPQSSGTTDSQEENTSEESSENNEIAKEETVDSTNTEESSTESVETEEPVDTTQEKVEEESQPSSSTENSTVQTSDNSEETELSEEKTTKTKASDISQVSEWYITVSGTTATINNYSGSTHSIIEIPTLEVLKKADSKKYGQCTKVTITKNGLNTGASFANNTFRTGTGSKIVVSDSSLFKFCSNFNVIKEVNLSNLDTSNVTHLASAFESCKNLTTINLSGWNVSNVTSMSAMFRNCTSLKSIPSNLNAAKATNFSSMFHNCTSLTTIDLNSWNVSSAIYMRNMFDGCSNLTTININRWDTSKLEAVDRMFADCTKLTKIDLSGWKTSKINTRSISDFVFCDSETPLLLLVPENDTVLKKMNYGSWNRIPLGPTFDSTDGSFSDGAKQKYYFEKCAMTVGDYNNKIVLDNFKTFTIENVPSRIGYIFKGWKDGNGNTPDSVTSVLDAQNTTFTAQWEKALDPNAPEGSTKLPINNSSLGIAYMPTLFELPNTELNEKGEQTIPFTEGNGFHIGVKDQQSGSQWSLRAKLDWTRSGMEAAYIQSKNTNGQVHKNKNDGQSDFEDSDLESTSDVSGLSNLKINSKSESIVMEASKGNREAVYDYALGDAELVIPESKYVQPDTYSGTVTWNLVKGP